jgi:hypothetical protein
VYFLNVDDGYRVVTKVAAAIVIVLGILVNVIVVYCCWSILYAEKDHHGNNMTAVKFLRHLIVFRKCPGSHHHRSTRDTNGLAVGESRINLGQTAGAPDGNNSKKAVSNPA